MNPRPAVELADIMRKFARAYLNAFGGRIPGVHLKAMHDIMACRTPRMGGTTFYCATCHAFQYSYHSCGNRNCNKCQNEQAQSWLEKTGQLLLPVPHFMVTFTLPEALRHLARSHQKLFYGLLLKTSAESLQALGYDSRHVGGLLAMMAVLHTWGRDLSYHPHVHVIVAGGGLLEIEDIWLPSRERFLVPVKALSRIFAAKFRDALKKATPEIFHAVQPQIWQQQWVVNSQAVGRGVHALKYLAQYIFRPAISNSRILCSEAESVTFKFQRSQTKRWHTMTLSGTEFIRRYLQHVLPRGFVKVRYYGLYAHRHRHTLGRLRRQMRKAEHGKSDPETKKESAHPVREAKTPAPLTCPCCGQPMLVVSEVRRGGPWPKAPPTDIRQPSAQMAMKLH